jgi:hypothetical protein
MRLLKYGLAALVLVAAAAPVQAKNLSKKEVQMCAWGADVARSAQKSKLSGTTLWRARQSLKSRKFSEPWMPKMAHGITEQTYASRSRLSPGSVKKAYYDGCVHHELSRGSHATMKSH